MSKVRMLWINRITAHVDVAWQVMIALALKAFLQVDVEITLITCVLYKMALERAERTPIDAPSDSQRAAPTLKSGDSHE